MTDYKVAVDTLKVTLAVETVEIQNFQFCGLLWTTEYNARGAAIGDGHVETVHARNTLLTAYAALEALVQESALVLHRSLYDDWEGFRKHGLVVKYKKYLEAEGRAEAVRDVIEEISEHRKALTHSEPVNKRSFHVGEVLNANEAARLAGEVRKTADWLWRGQRPGSVSAMFDYPNPFLGS
jgi:hypothetical protein